MDINKKMGGRRRTSLPRAVSLPYLAVLALLVMVVAVSCRHQEIPKRPAGPIVAKVGNSYLTLAELKESIPPEYSDVITRDQNVQYVRQWINTELLYQEALRQGINEEPVIKARLERMRKDLLSTELMGRNTAKSGIEIGEQAVREYYESNREQFIRDNSVVRYEDIVVPDINVAFEIRRTITHETFKTIAKKYTKQPAELEESVPYVVLDAIPPKLRNAIIATTALPAIIGPYGADDGFHILRVLGKFDKGTIASIDEVRDEIVSRLSNITQKDETERLISEIRAKSDVEFNLDIIPGIGTAAADNASAPAAPKPEAAKTEPLKPTASAPAAPKPVAPAPPKPAAPAPTPTPTPTAPTLAPGAAAQD